MMEEVFMTGTLEWRELRNWKINDLKTNFAVILQTYVTTKKKEGCLSDSTVEIYKGINFQFLKYVQDIGHLNFSTVTQKTASGFIPYISNKHPSGMHGVMTALRSFCKFLKETYLTENNLLSAFQTVVAPRRKVIFGFTRDEVDALLNAVDKEAAIGKRDYAILLLTKNTGLRSTDIVNLKFTNIDWKNDEIHIIQRKTNRPLILPLETDVGNAIYDYVLHGRPTSESLYIFLRMRPPFTKLTNHSSSMHSIICKYMNAVGVSQNQVKGKGFTVSFVV
ncbi:tyrosine-type recombinase/integrase [Paenibacillus sp. FSL M7-0896]|uniref:tyrosine-type recombinase/integrase n=1 Tax=Paenibacillus sp. FSL M7-0896 TaxID=2921610 RepID=UPI0030DD35D3